MNKENHSLTSELPVINFAGTSFYVDVPRHEFRQVDAPGNTISMQEIRATMEEATELAFDRNTKNIYQHIIDPENIPGHVTMVIVPPLKALEQKEAMAQKFRLSDNSQVKRRLRQKGHRV